MFFDMSHVKNLKRTREGAASVGLAEELEVEVESLAYGGDGVAHAPMAIFVPGAAPGDRLRVQVSRNRKSWARAEVRAILKPSPHRRPAPRVLLLLTS